jgi:hypothetical protein
VLLANARLAAQTAPINALPLKRMLQRPSGQVFLIGLTLPNARGSDLALFIKSALMI